MKLPFVWELNYKGIISHGVGLDYGVPNKYQKDIKKFLEGKEKLLVEKSIVGECFFQPFPLNPAIQDTACKMKIHVISLETPKEHAYAGLVYKGKPADHSFRKEILTTYHEGDENAMRSLVLESLKNSFSGADIRQIRKRTQRLGERSLEHIARHSCMMTVGVFHFTAYQPTLIDFYKEKGAEVKRIQ